MLAKKYGILALRSIPAPIFNKTPMNINPIYIIMNSWAWLISSGRQERPSNSLRETRNGFLN